MSCQCALYCQVITRAHMRACTRARERGKRVHNVPAGRYLTTFGGRLRLFLCLRGKKRFFFLASLTQRESPGDNLLGSCSPQSVRRRSAYSLLRRFAIRRSWPRCSPRSLRRHYRRQILPAWEHFSLAQPSL